MTFNSVISANSANNNVNRLLQDGDGNIISLIEFLKGVKNAKMNFTILDVPYPKFPPGKPHFMILN